MSVRFAARLAAAAVARPVPVARARVSSAVASVPNSFARRAHAHAAAPTSLGLFHPSRRGRESRVPASTSTYRALVSTTTAMASPAGSPSIPVPARGVKTTLLVITSKQHVNGDQLTRLTTTNEVLPLEKFDVHVGCAIEDFPEEVLENDNSKPVALLWWFGDAKVMADVLTKPAVQKNIKWMHAASAGVEHLLKEARIANSQTPLTNAKGAFSASLGEWSVFSFLWFNKHANAMRVSQKNKEWTRAPVGMLAGKTVLIAVRNFPNHHVPPPSLPILVPEGTITLTVYSYTLREIDTFFLISQGYGDIGRAVAVRAKALGMRVVGMRRDPGKSVGDVKSKLIDMCYKLTPETLKTQVASCDFVVLATPHTPETTNLMSREIFENMKPTSVFVNVGRGACVDEDALIEVLTSNKIAGAALDVTKTEPLPSESPLWGMENVFLSFHTADLTDDYFDLTLRVFKQHVSAYLGEPVEQTGDSLNAPAWNLVNKESGY